MNMVIAGLLIQGGSSQLRKIHCLAAIREAVMYIVTEHDTSWPLLLDARGMPHKEHCKVQARLSRAIILYAVSLDICVARIDPYRCIRILSRQLV
jgi:hypothetical protein